MSDSVPKKTSRREKVIDTMAKKFADRGAVEQIIVRHRKKMLRSSRTLYIIAAVTIASMIMTGLVTVGVIEPPEVLQKKADEHAVIVNSIDLFRADLSSGVLSPDQFVMMCKLYLVRYDSLPAKYKTKISTTTRDEVYGAIADVWPQVSLRTRERLLRDLPYIKEIQMRRREGQIPRQ